MNEYVPETLLRILQSPLCKVCLKLRKCLQSILDLKYNILQQYKQRESKRLEIYLQEQKIKKVNARRERGYLNGNNSFNSRLMGKSQE